MASRSSDFPPSAPEDLTEAAGEPGSGTPPAFDPSLYPATYRSSAGAGLAFFLVFVGYALLTLVGRGHLLRVHSSAVWIFALAVLGLVTLLALDFIFGHITLHADRIERSGLIGRKVMRRTDIAGSRLEGLFRIRCLIHKDSPASSLALPFGAQKDAAWNAWMDAIPDLDAIDEEKVLSDIKKYPKLGASSQEREIGWSNANKVARICVWMTFAAMLLVFVPALSAFAVTVPIVTPWIALRNIKRYGLTFSSIQRNPAIGNILTIFSASAALGVFGAIYPPSRGVLTMPQEAMHIHFLIAGPAFGLVLLVPMLRVILSKSQWRDLPARVAAEVFLVPWMVLFAWCYGIGTALEINTLFDFSKPVLHTSATLIGGSWGCLQVHAGLLYAWSVLVPCQN